MAMHVEKPRSAGWPAVARVAGRLGVALVIALAGYLLIYRPLQLRWGASGEEVARVMPGDEIQRQPIFNATRAVTINARPEQIWPWLVQIGYKRAGGTATTGLITMVFPVLTASSQNCST